MRQGYKRATGAELVGSGERKKALEFQIILHSIPEKMSQVPKALRGTGAAGALVYLRKGRLLKDVEIWDKKELLPGAIIQGWLERSELERVKRGQHTRNLIAGHSFVFVEYVGEDEMMVVQPEGDLRKKKRRFYEVWFAANWSSREAGAG